MRWKIISGVAALLVSLAALAGFALRGRLGGSLEPRAAAGGGSFTITLQETLKCANDDVSMIVTEAMASDGSRCTLTQRRDGTLEKYVRKADGIMFRAYEHAGVKSTLQVSPQTALGGELDPGKDCLGTVGGGNMMGASKAGEETLHGSRTVKIVTDAGGARVTAWHAPELGCVAIRRLYEEKDKAGNWKEISLLEATHIRRGEPDPALFESQAAEVRPSEAAEAVVRHNLKKSALRPEQIEARVAQAKQRAANRDANYDKYGVK